MTRPENPRIALAAAAFVLPWLAPPGIDAQASSTIAGTVRDFLGRPLPGVAVLLLGPKTGQPPIPRASSW